jgi:hypothetical protein
MQKLRRKEKKDMMLQSGNTSLFNIENNKNSFMDKKQKIVETFTIQGKQ